MRKVRVLVVDDSVVVRKVLAGMLESDPDIEVVGTAPDGRVGLQKISLVRPDIVTLDVEMPEWDGLRTLQEIRAVHPGLPVVMCSTLTSRGATTALDALALGATDCVGKPTSLGRGANAEAASSAFRADLVAKIKGICAPALAREDASPVSRDRRAPLVASTTGPPSGVDIVAIGSSTGGPQALTTVLSALSPRLPVPIVIAQHMPPVFTTMFAERLASSTGHAVREATPGEKLKPGTVWVAPGDYHMVIRSVGTQVVTALNQDAPVNSCRPSVDVLFDSVAEVHGRRVLAVVLTGMGQDGMRGCEHIRSLGGQVIAQDEATSVVWGMPGRVVECGLADAILPLDDVAGAIETRVLAHRASVTP